MARRYNMHADDHARVTAAVHAAEHSTSGEIVTIVADHSDRYLDVALWWSIFTAVLALATAAAFPDIFECWRNLFGDGWVAEPGISEMLTFALAVTVITFVTARFMLHWVPLRLFMTPRSVKAIRVHRRAIRYFKVGAERRTAGRTGVLIYLSLMERRAEIVADESIHALIPQDRWGETMAALLEHVSKGEIATGLCAAVGDVGTILSENFPRNPDDVNELPDRLIEL